MDAAREHIPYTYEFTDDSPYQVAFTRALFWAQFRAFSPWLLVALLLLLIGFSLVGHLSWFVVAFWVILGALVIAVRYWRVHQAVRVGFPVGKQMRTGFGATHFAISDGPNSSVIAYSGSDSIRAGAVVVWIRKTTPKRRLAYPRALFPDAEVERIRAFIDNAGSAQLS